MFIFLLLLPLSINYKTAVVHIILLRALRGRNWAPLRVVVTILVVRHDQFGHFFSSRMVHLYPVILHSLHYEPTNGYSMLEIWVMCGDVIVGDGGLGPSMGQKRMTNG